MVDNRYQPKVALKNAELLIREGVDLVIEFQTDEAVAPAIASAYNRAGIPMIAIDIPHPGATYFGANNCEAGLLAGRHLARWAKQHWEGPADEILVLDLARAGSLPAARGRGVVAGVRETLHDAAGWPVVSIDADGQFKTSLERVRKHLRETRARRTIRARSAPRARSRRAAAPTAAPPSARTPSPTRAPSCAPRGRRSSPRSATSRSATARD